MVTFETDARYAVTIAGQQYGFTETRWSGFDRTWTTSTIAVGPVGKFSSPVSAATGFGLLLGGAAAIIALAALLVRRRQAANSS